MLGSMNAKKEDCMVDGCAEPSHTRGVCLSHYGKFRYATKKGIPIDFVVAESKKYPGIDFVHGKAGGYSNHRCRCEPCKKAWNESCRLRKRAKWESWDGEPDPSLVHGSPNTYQNHGCRCRECKASHAKATTSLARIKRSAGYLAYKNSVTKCEICDLEKILVTDHDHFNGVFRGMICHGCNTGLGKLGDSPELLVRALAYLKKEPPDLSA